MTQDNLSPDDGAVHRPDWGDFRDHLPTADPRGRRVWVYPRKPSGPYHRARLWVSGVLLGVMFAGPFIRINGNPLLRYDGYYVLSDIVEIPNLRQKAT